MESQTSTKYMQRVVTQMQTVWNGWGNQAYRYYFSLILISMGIILLARNHTILGILIMGEAVILGILTYTGVTKMHSRKQALSSNMSGKSQ